MKAVIELDVPEWQIRQDVSVYFPDTMLKHGKCEMMEEQEAVEPICQIIFDVPYYFCGNCKTMLNMYAVKAKYCSNCARMVKWI